MSNLLNPIDKMQALKHDQPNFQSDCSIIANELTTNKTTLADIVQKLEVLVTSTELDDRVEGIYILSTILSKIRIDLLKRDEVEHLCLFYKGRLNDHYKVISPLLIGIHALSNYSIPLEKPAFTEILVTMFQTVSCQSQPHVDRLKIYEIIKTLLRTQTKYLLDLGPDFVYGVISAIDGERDPRNLLFLFEWLPEFINKVQLGHLVEEMHEVMACYFPVDFRVPAKDAQGISRDKLASALKPCLCANPEFAEFTLPLILEKLDADLVMAKMDSLELLLEACDKFNGDEFLKYQTELWSALQREFLKNPSIEVEELLSNAIIALLRAIPPDHAANSISTILETNGGNLIITEKMFKSTWKLLLAISRATESSAKQILNYVQPRLINLFNISANSEQKYEIMNILMLFMQAGNTFEANVDAIPQWIFTVLMQHDDQLRSLALRSFCLIDKQMAQNELKLPLMQQTELIFADDTAEVVRQAFLQCVLFYKESCNNELLTMLQSFHSRELKNNELKNILDNLSALAAYEPFTTYFFKFQHKYYLDNQKLCINTLRKAMESSKSEHLMAAVTNSQIVESKLLDMAILLSYDIEDLMNIRGILMKLLSTFTVGQQSQFLQLHFDKVKNAFFTLDNSNVIFILSGLLTTIYPQLLSENGILCKLFDASLVEDVNVRQISIELLSNIINKLPSGYEHILNQFETSLRERLNYDDTMKDKYGFITIWIAKALYMRGDSCSTQWLNLLMAYLPHSRIVANDIGIILKDCESLSEASHAQIRLLYRQRVFTAICEKLNQAFTTYSSENECYVLAFGSLMQYVPSLILKINFEKILRLIMLCLDNCSEASAQISILNAIKIFIASKDELSRQYLEDFMPRLLNATESASMQVRILALQCLRLYINEFIPIHVLMGHKGSVIARLGRCIDDKKRLVRKEATDTRLKWYLLGAPI